MKSFPFASSGDPIRRHVTKEWINAINAYLRPQPEGTNENSAGSMEFPETIVRVDSNLTGGGWYLGKFSGHPNLAVDTATDLAESPWFGATYIGDCVIANWLEQNLSTHDLTATISGGSTNNVFAAIRWGYAKSGDDYLPCYHITGLILATCPLAATPAYDGGSL